MKTPSPSPSTSTSTSPSRIALEAAGRSPVGVLKAKCDGNCAFCGHAYLTSDLVMPFAPESSFTDYGSMRRPGSKFLCGWCAGAWNVDFTQKALKTVMCSEGVFPAASNADIAYWLTNPPKGNWVWVMGDQKRQHIVWRATVNTSQSIFQIRLGENNMTVRREHLFLAVDAARRLAVTASTGRKGAALKSPFLRLSRDLDEPAHGMVRDDLHRLAQTNVQVRADVRLMQSCTPGELWALTAMLYALPSAVRPQALFS